MKLSNVCAIVQPENIASKKVIENMGLKYEYVLRDLPEGFEWNEGELYYSLSRDEYFK